MLTVDASLAKMVFDTDQRTEWIYRGSTRLGPLYNEAHKQLQAQNSAAPTRRRRHDLDKAGRGIKVNFVIESSSLCNIFTMEIYQGSIGFSFLAGYKKSVQFSGQPARTKFL